MLYDVNMKALEGTIKELERELARPDGGVPGYVVMMNGRDLLDLLNECQWKIGELEKDNKSLHGLLDLQDAKYYQFWLRGITDDDVTAIANRRAAKILDKP